jgi:LysR family hydrogen peroxide-inducible transcriptional activator
MTLTELKYIVAVAREKHFGKAAEACFVSQPTLSVAIKKLEDELEVKLFERSANEVTVTPLGEEIVRQAQSVLEQAANIKEIARRGKDPLAGPLKLGIIYTIGPYLLPDLVRQAIARTPQMPLMLQENFTVKLLEMLRTGEIDCAIMAEPFPDTGLATAALYDEPFMVALPSNHPLAAHTHVNADELKKGNHAAAGQRPTAFATMCWRCAPSSPAFPATRKASARVLKVRRWRPSSTWWPQAWA